MISVDSYTNYGKTGESAKSSPVFAGAASKLVLVLGSQLGNEQTRAVWIIL
jgi:hypothetical protein